MPYDYPTRFTREFEAGIPGTANDGVLDGNFGRDFNSKGREVT